MAESNVDQVPSSAKVLGWISMGFSGLGIIGMVLILIATAIPSVGSTAHITSEDASKTLVFLCGEFLGMLSPFPGGLTGIISLVIMLKKHNTKMIWLPITGIALGAIAFFGTILASVNLINTLS